MNVTCVHDAWWTTDRIVLAVLVGLMMAIGTRQAYMAGVRDGRAEGPLAVATKTAYDAGWNACMEQF